MTIVKRRKVAYQRELQVVLEYPPDIEYWGIINAPKKSVSTRVLTTKKHRKLRWYFDSRLNLESVADLASAKADLIDHYTNYPYKFTSQPEGV
ncbi:MAG: hypothetical protein ACUVTD_03525 [Nitrososphaerales archaeon]